MLINLEFGFSAFGSSSPSYVVCSMRGNCAMQEAYPTVTNTVGPILILPMLGKVGCSSFQSSTLENTWCSQYGTGSDDTHTTRYGAVDNFFLLSPMGSARLSCSC